MMKMIMMVIKCVSAFPGLGWTPCHQMCALPLHLQVLLIIRIITIIIIIIIIIII